MSRPTGLCSLPNPSPIPAPPQLSLRRSSPCSCYYACFQAAIAALRDADIGARSGASPWSHRFVQAEFVGRLINQRKLYPVQLRQVLARQLTLRHTADYAPDIVTQTQAARALQRTRDFLDAIQKRVNTHAG